ncbi:protein FAM81A-like [Styela clava]
MSDNGYDGTVVVRRSDRRGNRRLNHLEDRLLEQERATKSLIEKAFEFKEALSSDIRPSSMDDALQQLWHEHIRSVTSSVKKLSRDVEELKFEISSRDRGIVDASYQAKNVEQFAHAGVADLRGRVARCDALIARLAQDVRSATSANELDKKHVDQSTDTNKHKIDHLEREISELTRRLDIVMTQQEGKIEVIKGTSSSQLQAMDSRMRQVLEDIRLSIDSNRKWSESERTRIEHQISQIMELNASLAQSKQDAMETRLLEKMDSLQRSVEECKLDISKVREEMTSTLDSRSRIGSMVKDLGDRLDQDISKLKSEYRESFASVKESIDTTNRLINGKIKLVKDEMTRDINNIRKMVVLI